ncbi:MAG: hypothetical protein JJ872_11730 [Marivivens sp.]|jgi:queuine/archaeosine tRNA-ribosyltransferase|nr:hypothetical protein [Marivivens sp.]
MDGDLEIRIRLEEGRERLERCIRDDRMISAARQIGKLRDLCARLDRTTPPTAEVRTVVERVLSTIQWAETVLGQPARKGEPRTPITAAYRRVDRMQVAQ